MAVLYQQVTCLVLLTLSAVITVHGAMRVSNFGITELMMIPVLATIPGVRSTLALRAPIAESQHICHKKVAQPNAAATQRLHHSGP